MLREVASSSSRVQPVALFECNMVTEGTSSQGHSFAGFWWFRYSRSMSHILFQGVESSKHIRGILENFVLLPSTCLTWTSIPLQNLCFSETWIARFSAEARGSCGHHEFV